MDKQRLYDSMAARKGKPSDYDTYDGNNGRVNRCVKLFEDGILKSGGVLLDVGGGIGDLGYALRGRFDERIVLDISSKNLVAAGSKGNKLIVSDVDCDGFGLENESVDVVTALDFIEHIIDPENFCREAFRVLKHGGQIFINTPNIQYFEHLESLVCRGVFPHTSGDQEVYHGGHLAFYCFDDMRKLLSGAGFTDIIQIRDTEGFKVPPPIWQNLLSVERSSAIERLGNPNLLVKAVKR